MPDGNQVKVKQGVQYEMKFGFFGKSWIPSRYANNRKKVLGVFCRTKIIH